MSAVPKTDSNIASLGALSGVLSAFVYGLRDLFPEPFSPSGMLFACFGKSGRWGCLDHDLWTAYMPGVIFGIVVGFGLWRWHKLDARRWAAFTLASAFCYALARQAAEKLTGPLGVVFDWFELESGAFAEALLNNALLGVDGFIAGALGGGALAVLCLWIDVVDRAKALVWTGAAAGIFLPVMIGSGLSLPLSALIFFPVWQTAYAWMLGAALEKK